MLTSPAFATALQMARTKDAQTLTDCAWQGMMTALDEFATASPVKGASRAADGLNGIDAAIALLRQTWPTAGSGGVADSHVNQLLSACRAWLDGRQLFGKRITGWREAAVKELYWQVAWCYSCDNYAKCARSLVLHNNTTGKPTTVFAPVNEALPVGNPYWFHNSEYVRQTLPGNTRLFRGESRGPDAIYKANGFQPKNLLDPSKYAPWFSGNGTGDTISCTTDEALAIEAGPAAKKVRNKVDPPPNWLPPRVTDKGVVGYVYEIDWAVLSKKHSLRMNHQAVGREEVYLSIPAAHILFWWVVLMDRTTFGPLIFPIPTPPPRFVPNSAQFSKTGKLA